MRRDAAEYGGRFTSHLVLNEPGRPDLYNQWFDFYFLGMDRFTIWNAEIVTARQAFWDAAHNEASSRAYAALGDADLDREPKLDFEPADVSRTGKVLTYRIVKREPVRYVQFDGRTLSEQIDRLPDSFPATLLLHKFAKKANKAGANLNQRELEEIIINNVQKEDRKSTASVLSAAVMLSALRDYPSETLMLEKFAELKTATDEKELEKAVKEKL